MKKMVCWLALLGLLAVPVAARVSDESVRARLMTEALDSVGACTPVQAVVLWGRGLRNRNAALQYAMMTTELKEKYTKALAKNFPNWVTGVSSPWVESYALESLKRDGEDAAVAIVSFQTETSTGPAERYMAELSLVKQDGYWRIADVDGDEGLRAYTGL